MKVSWATVPGWVRHRRRKKREKSPENDLCPAVKI